MSKSFKSFEDAAKAFKESIPEEQKLLDDFEKIQNCQNQPLSKLEKQKLKYAETEEMHIGFDVKEKNIPNDRNECDVTSIAKTIEDDLDAIVPEKIIIDEDSIVEISIENSKVSKKAPSINCPKHKIQISGSDMVSIKKENRPTYRNVVIYYCPKCKCYYVNIGNYASCEKPIAYFKGTVVYSIPQDQEKLAKLLAAPRSNNIAWKNPDIFLNGTEGLEKNTGTKSEKTPYIPRGYKNKPATPYEEEKDHLKMVVSEINKVVGYMHRKVSSLREELHNLPAGHYEDFLDREDTMAEIVRKEDRAAQYEMLKGEPYFGRMDFDISHNNKFVESKTIYIGKEGFDSLENEILVYDWRSDVAETFYQKTQRQFNIKDYQYDLNLRRAFNIKNSELVEMNTEYSRDESENLGPNADIVDPFLIQILKDKRRERKLTDIIQSIQEKQIEIIRLPKNTTFIVQGCAGSGKTMILLHRLSYLKFNNPKESWDGVKIITPNSFFDDYIKEVSAVLNLDKIERLSVEQYYVSLIKKYCDHRNLLTHSKDTVIESNVRSETGLNLSFLHEIYSEDFVKRCSKRFNSYSNEIKQAVEDLNILSKFNGQDRIKMPLKATAMLDYVSSFNNVVNIIGKDIDRRIDAERIARQDFAEESQQLSKYEKMLPDKEANIRSNTTSAKEFLDTEIAEIKTLLADIEKRIALNTETIHSNDAAMKEIAEKEGRSQMLLDSLNGTVDESFDLSSLPDSIKEKYSNLIDEALRIKAELEHTIAINFTKRNRLRNEYKEKIKELIPHILNVRSHELDLVKANLEEFKKNKAEFGQQNLKLNDVIAKDKEEKRINDKVLSLLTAYNSKFISGTYPNISSLNDLYKADFNDSKIKAHTNVLMLLEQMMQYQYQSAYAEWASFSKAYTACKNRLSDAKDKLNTAVKNLPSEEEKQTRKEASILLSKANYSQLYQNSIQAELSEVCDRYNTVLPKENFRFKLYLELLCNYYYAGPLKSPDRWLNIDEAQDIDKSEYVLLRNILGSSCIFNLYGDLNQLVYTYKGIDDWKSLRGVVSGKQYELNENYRNTIQITDYCNNYFGAEIYPIGVTGAPVIELPLANALSNFMQFYYNNEDIRAAIIYQGVIARNKLETSLQKNNFSWNQVDPNKISVLTVEQAKGLEFDAVLVVTEEMNDNELYISLTRALDNLFVAK